AFLEAGAECITSASYQGEPCRLRVARPVASRGGRAHRERRGNRDRGARRVPAGAPGGGKPAARGRERRALRGRPARRLRVSRSLRPRPRSIARVPRAQAARARSEEHTSELQSRENLVCRLLLEKKTNHRAQINDSVN